MNSETEDNPRIKPHHHIIRGWHFKTFIITIIIAALGYLLCAFWGGWKDVWLACKKVGFEGVAVALLLSMSNYLLRFIRWEHFLKILGQNVKWTYNFLIYIAGFSLTTTPGKAGEALRSIFLKDFHVPYRKSFGAFLAERFSDLIAVILLASWGLYFYEAGRLIVLLTTTAILLIFYAIQKDSWLLSTEAFLKKKLSKSLGHYVEFALETVRSFRSCFQTRVLIYATIVGVLAWGAEGTAFYYILNLLGSRIDYMTSIFIYAFSTIIGAITFLPGGLGGVELTMLQLLLFNGLQPPEAAAATVVIRLTTLWFSVLIGLLALPPLIKGK